SDDVVDMSPRKLMEINAVPDVSVLKDVKRYIKAICLSHAHLDHVGAVPFIAGQFDCPVHGTPFTIEVLKTIMQDESLHLNNELVIHKTNSKFRVSDNIEIEFINVTHSTPHTVIIAVHTKEGTVVYANDFKFDNAPLLGQKPNFDKLRSLKTKLLIMDSLYAKTYIKTPSESIAREMLRDVMLGTNSVGKSMVVTTFASHLARIRSIYELGIKLNRKVVFLGRSLAKYTLAGERCGLVDFNKKIEIVKYGSKIKNYLNKVAKPEKYLFVVTGHQAEPQATLSKMVQGAFKWKEGDIMIFSCNIIPVLENINHREKMEAELRARKVRIFRDIHVSGHAAREDHRDMISLVKPEHIIPTHATPENLEALKDLAIEMGHAPETIHIIKNGQRLKI
ncbi:MAG: MBL fold metallo-hydrolase, partial [Nanoarchaeota archaeon]|nr:MBL fold metallo-hydrolase [Nanoarchaeota archaeon]